MGLKEPGLRGSLRNVSVGMDAIPDALVDNFEDEPNGIYESGETIVDYYSNDTGSYGRTTSNVEEGEQALGRTVEEAHVGVVSEPGDGLNRYPDEGDTVKWIAVASELFGGILLNADSSDQEGYLFEINPNDNLEIQKITSFESDGVSQLAENTNVGMTTGNWYWCEADLPTTEDDSMECRVFELDSGLEKGDSVSTLSANDNDFSENRGVGAYTRSGSDTGALVDWIRVDD